MTTSDKDNTTHKRPPAKADPPAGQSFDIIPRSQVRPTVTSRPVLTSTKPEQTDNTLLPETQAASAQLSHQTLKFSTTPNAAVASSAPELADADAEALLEKVSSINAEEPQKPQDKEGREVREDHEDHEAPQPKEGDSNDIADGTEGGSGSEEGGSTAAEAESKEAAGQAPKAGLGEDVEPSDGSIDHLLKEDKQETIEHSQALKDELQSLKDKPEDEVRPHHELYGGKPVIVIHKAKGAKATLNWILWFIFCLLLALVIVDALLDSGVISTDYSIPHTHWLQ